MSNPTYHNDDIIRIDHSPQSNSDPTANNTVGATISDTRTIDYTPSDLNSIYVDGINGDDGDVGDSANPVKTISKANELVTATKTKIYIVDSSTYSETPIIFNSDFEGIYSAVEQTPIIDITTGTKATDSLVELTDYHSTKGPGAVELENGDIFVIYGSTTQTLCRTIDGTTKIANDDETVVTNTDFAEFSCCLTSDGNIFVHAGDSTRSSVYFVLDKTDFTNFIKAVTTFSAGSFFYMTCIKKANNELLIMYDNNTNVYYGVIDTDYTIKTAETQFVASRKNIELNRLLNGNIFACYISSNTIYYQEIQDDLSSVVAETTTGITGVALEHSEAVLDSGRIAIAYDNDDFGATTGRSYSYKIFEDDYTLNSVIGEQSLNVGTGAELEIISAEDNMFNFLIDIVATLDYHLVYNNNKPVVNILELPSGQACKFDGITIESDFVQGFEYLFLQQNDFTLKDCTIQNIPSVSGINNLGLINNTSTYDNIITNCLFTDCYLEISIVTNNADIQQNIFFNIVGTTIIEIDGAGSSIIFDHNTFFNCSNGILLTNNDGDEVIKNSIFHELVSYDVKCDTTLIIIYCDSTGTLTGCTADANTLLINPRFKNLGIDYTANLDLNLKSEALGDDYTSPCIGNALDTKDMGAYDRSIAYSADTYSTIYIQKPDLIDIKYNAVNNSRNTNLDGTVRTYKDGAVKELSLKWTGILNEDYNELLAFWYSHAGTVKVYLDPETKPSEYEVYYLDYKNINGSPKKSPLLSKTGVSDVEIILLKAYKG